MPPSTRYKKNTALFGIEEKNIDASLYDVTEYRAVINADEYIRKYRNEEKFIGFCRACRHFSKTWSCPPFLHNEEKCLDGFTLAIIFGTLLKIGSNLYEQCFEIEICKKIVYRLIEQERKRIDTRLLQLEIEYPKSRAFYAGTCYLCGKRPCTRVTNKPCRYPQQMRPSLEAFGFDIGATSEHLLGLKLDWGSPGKPLRHITLISGFFTNTMDIDTLYI